MSGKTRIELAPTFRLFGAKPLGGLAAELIEVRPDSCVDINDRE